MTLRHATLRQLQVFEGVARKPDRGIDGVRIPAWVSGAAGT